MQAVHGPVQRAQARFSGGSAVGALICHGNRFIEFLREILMNDIDVVIWMGML